MAASTPSPGGGGAEARANTWTETFSTGEPKRNLIKCLSGSSGHVFILKHKDPVPNEEVKKQPQPFSHDENIRNLTGRSPFLYIQGGDRPLWNSLNVNQQQEVKPITENTNHARTRAWFNGTSWSPASSEMDQQWCAPLQSAAQAPTAAFTCKTFTVQSKTARF